MEKETGHLATMMTTTGCQFSEEACRGDMSESSLGQDRMMMAGERIGNGGEIPYERNSNGEVPTSPTRSTRNSMKPSGNTHNNIFGEPPVSPRRAGKVYHMSSDIFGVGSIVDRAGTHLKSQSDHKTAIGSASNEGILRGLEGDVGKTQKRHYPRGRSQSLW